MQYWTDFEWQRLIGHALVTLVILGGAFGLWLILARSFRLLEARSKLPASVLFPFRLVARYGVALVALLLCLTVYGIPVGSFWTLVSTTVGLVAIGFVAVWSVLSNISSTFLILTVRPFRVGDDVSLVGEDVMGKVIDINFLFTTLMKGNGDIFKVPNNQFFQKSLLRPADPGRLEGSDDRGHAAEIDHSQANMEGIETGESARSSSR